MLVPEELMAPTADYGEGNLRINEGLDMHEFTIRTSS